MKIGISTGVYVNYPLDETTRRIAAAGYDAIDYWGGRPHVYRQDFDAGALRAQRALAESLGLAAPSLLPAFFRYPHSLISPNETVWRDSIGYVKQSIDNAALLGAPIVLLVPTMSLYGQAKADAWERLVRATDELCAYARPRGITLGIEVVNRFVSDLIIRAADALPLLERVAHANLGVVLDTGHMNLVDEPYETAVTSLGDRLLQVHVNDNDGRQQQNLVPGDGTFEFARLRAALRAARFDGFLTVELGHHFIFDPDPAAQSAVQRLRAWLESAA
jgi:fructoselysine 3-epimerase